MQSFSNPEKILPFRLNDKLADAGMIPEIDENQPAMISFSMHPSAELHGMPLGSGVQMSAIMGTKTVFQTFSGGCSLTHISMNPLVENNLKN
jgi:hypothetical protein